MVARTGMHAPGFHLAFGWLRAGPRPSAALFLAAALVAGAAHADSAVTPARLSELHDAYYGDRVLEYCGLYTEEVHDGFLRRVRYLLASADIDAATGRSAKISGWTDADYQYDNHGLGGFRHWCATDGRKAAAAFLAFRQQELAGSTP
jgi:hypothetical protein